MSRLRKCRCERRIRQTTANGMSLQIAKTALHSSHGWQRSFLPGLASAIDGDDDRRARRAPIDDDVDLADRIVDAVPQSLHRVLEQPRTFHAFDPRIHPAQKLAGL